MNTTCKYYQENSDDFIDNTFNCDMSVQYNLFEKYIKNKDTILDLGFGSGRDSLYFQSKYEVYSIDPVEKFCDHGKELGLKNVFNLTAENMTFENIFDGIWACASLLHVKSENLNKAFINCSKSLKSNGIIYCSFKYGDFEGLIKGREFIFLTEQTILKYLNNTNLELVESIITEDVRVDRANEKWLNCIFRKTI